MTTRQEAEELLALKSVQDPNFREQLKANPKAVVSQEFNTQVPDHITIEVMEETPNKMYLVIPAMPSVEEELSEEQLEAVAGGAVNVILGGRGWYFVYQG